MCLRLAILGDSIAHGQGASRPSDALGPRLENALRALGLTVTTRVLAVPGARSEDLARQAGLALDWEPDLALVIIGANDLTHAVPPRLAAQALGDAVRRLRGSGTEVVVAPAPDLSVVPHVPPALRQVVQNGSRFLGRLQVEQVLAADGRVADLQGRTTQAFGDDLALFSRDRFHPSSEGYAVIAEALLPEVAAAAAERSSAQM